MRRQCCDNAVRHKATHVCPTAGTRTSTAYANTVSMPHVAIFFHPCSSTPALHLISTFCTSPPVRSCVHLSYHILFFVCCAGDVHPFFFATQYHPEFQSHPHRPSPPFLGFLYAAIGQLAANVPLSSASRRAKGLAQGPPPAPSHAVVTAPPATTTPTAPTAGVSAGAGLSIGSPARGSVVSSVDAEAPGSPLRSTTSPHLTTAGKICTKIHTQCRCVTYVWRRTVLS